MALTSSMLLMLESLELLAAPVAAAEVPVFVVVFAAAEPLVVAVAAEEPACETLAALGVSAPESTTTSRMTASTSTAITIAACAFLVCSALNAMTAPYSAAEPLSASVAVPSSLIFRLGCPSGSTPEGSVELEDVVEVVAAALALLSSASVAWVPSR